MGKSDYTITPWARERFGLGDFIPEDEKQLLNHCEEREVDFPEFVWANEQGELFVKCTISYGGRPTATPAGELFQVTVRCRQTT